MWAIWLLTMPALSRPMPVEALQDRVTGAVFVEVGGAGFFYSVNGQVLFPTSIGGLGLRAGASYVDLPSSGIDLGPIATFPVALTFRAGHRPWAFEAGLDATPAWWIDDAIVLVAPMVGVDHRARSGLLFGAHAQVDFSSGGSILPWGGVRVGSWFPRSPRERPE